MTKAFPGWTSQHDIARSQRSIRNGNLLFCALLIPKPLLLKKPGTRANPVIE